MNLPIVDEPCCKEIKEYNYKLGKYSEPSKPNGWIAKVTWKSTRDQKYIWFTMSESYSLSIDETDKPHESSYYFVGSEAKIVACFCDDKGPIPFLTKLKTSGRSGTLRTSDDPSRQKIDDLKIGEAEWGITFQRAVNAQGKDVKDIPTPHGPITPITKPFLISYTGDVESIPLEPGVWLGNEKAIKWFEKNSFENIDEHKDHPSEFWFTAVNPDTGKYDVTCADIGVSPVLNSEGEPQRSIAGWLCKGKRNEFRILRRGLFFSDIKISQVDADYYRCGEMHEGKKQYLDLCDVPLIPRRITKCHDLGEVDPNLQWEWKQIPIEQRHLQIGKKSLNAIVGIAGDDSLDRSLEKPPNYAVAIPEKIEFIYCGCCNCCAIGEYVLEIFKDL